MTVDFDIAPDEYGYITFSDWWNQNARWRERIKAAWTILRGKQHYFSEVILTPEQLQEIKDYINKL